MLQRRYWLVLTSLLTTALASVAYAAPRLPTHVACVGDSITQGVGASNGSASYPANLQKLLGDAVKVGNFGHSGATMLSQGFGDLPYQGVSEYQGATSFVTNAGPNAVVDVIILLGANDSSSRNWTPAGKPKNDQQYLKDYRAMVEHFAALSPKPVVYLVLPLATGMNCSCGTLCCQISGSVIYDEQIPLLKQLAEEKKLPTIDLYAATMGHPEYFKDGIHPNDAGYVVVAQAMKDGLMRVPSVKLTAPLAGASLSSAMPILLSADASRDSVAIDSVEFFQGLVSLGQAKLAPFSVSWPATAGDYGLSAKAIDSTGASATSETVAVTVAMPSGGTPGVAGSAGTTAGMAGAMTAGVTSGGTDSDVGMGGAVAGANVAGNAGAMASAGVATTTPETEASSCSCRLVNGNGSSSTFARVLPLLGLLIWLARRARA